MNDKTTNLHQLKSLVGNFVRERGWGRFHSPKNLAMSISIEAAELMEIFQWVDSKEAVALLKNQRKARHVKEELADILIYIISLCDSNQIDIATIVNRKLARNRARFPVKQVGGDFLKKYR